MIFPVNRLLSFIFQNNMSRVMIKRMVGNTFNWYVELGVIISIQWNQLEKYWKPLFYQGILVASFLLYRMRIIKKNQLVLAKYILAWVLKNYYSNDPKWGRDSSYEVKFLRYGSPLSNGIETKRSTIFRIVVIRK